MRIAVVLTALPPLDPATLRPRPGRGFGGVEGGAVHLAHALVLAGHEVWLVAAGARGEGDLDLGKLHVRRHATRLKVGRAPMPPSLVRDALRGVPDVDVVLARMGNQPGPWGAARAARKRGVPLVVSHHGEWVGGFGGPLRRLGVQAQERWLGPRIARQAAALIALSQGALDASALLQAERAKVHIIPNGVQAFAAPSKEDRAAARRRLGIPAAAPVVIFVGSLNPIKGVDVLLDAFARLRATRPAAILALLGEGSHAGALQAQADRLRLGGSARFEGFVLDKADWLAAADVAALPSRSEAFPNVILEAGMAALPVVASDLPVLRSMVDDGESGLLVRPGDAAALADALGRLCSDAALRRRLGSANRKRSLACSWDEVARRTADLLGAVADAGAGAGGGL